MYVENLHSVLQVVHIQVLFIYFVNFEFECCPCLNHIKINVPFLWVLYCCVCIAVMGLLDSDLKNKIYRGNLFCTKK